MATDKRLDQVSQLTDFDYALIVKGTDVAKVTKQQLAELVGNLLYGATTKETLASVVAGFMPFQRIESFPVVESAAWMLLGRMPSSSAVVFMYSNITFVNAVPALYAVTAYNYNGSQYELSCKLVAGSSGGDYTSNIKYKVVNGEVYIWVKGSAGYSSQLMIISGVFKVEGIKENPPVDAIQPSVV